MVILIAQLLAGFTMLLFGGDFLVKGAVKIATFLGISAGVAGLTIVALGTSAPELAVSSMGALLGQTEMAVSNVIGSNLFNMCLVLGLCALIQPLVVSGQVIRLEWPFLFFATAMSVFLLRDGTVGPREGLLFLTMLAFFLLYVVYISRKKETAEEKLQSTEEVEAKKFEPPLSFLPSVFWVLLGSGLLVLGSRLTVNASVEIAHIYGLSERIIGLTIVALGTSLPELAASMMACVRKHGDVAIGNVIGSNIFNLLLILGVASIITPLQVGVETFNFDAIWMLGVTALLLPLMWTSLQIRKIEGLSLVIIYVAYMGMIFIR